VGLQEGGREESHVVNLHALQFPALEAIHFERCLAGTAYLVSVVAMPDDLPDLRASHEDRDRVVDTLRVAGGDGRLTAEELDARLERVLSARTLGELAELTADLPSASAAEDVLVVKQHGGKYVKEERWLVPARIALRTRECRVTLDFMNLAGPINARQLEVLQWIRSSPTAHRVQIV